MFTAGAWTRDGESQGQGDMTRRKRASLVTHSWALMMLRSSRTCWVKSMLNVGWSSAKQRRCSICSMAFSTVCDWHFVYGVLGAGTKEGGRSALMLLSWLSGSTSHLHRDASPRLCIRLSRPAFLCTSPASQTFSLSCPCPASSLFLPDTLVIVHLF